MLDGYNTCIKIPFNKFLSNFELYLTEGANSMLNAHDSHDNKLCSTVCHLLPSTLFFSS